MIFYSKYKINFFFPFLPSVPKVVVLNRKGIRVQLVTVRQEIPPTVNKNVGIIIFKVIVSFETDVAQGMLSQLTGVKCFIRHQQELRVVLFFSWHKLPKIDWTSYLQCISFVDSHSVEVSKVSNPPHVLVFRSVGEEAHALQPAKPEGFINRKDNLILSKLIKNGA